jgi:hypothetical protein
MVINTEDHTAHFELEDESNKMNCPSELNKIGEKVKIKSIKKESMEPEDYYYLKKFENRIGTICEQNKCKSGVYNYKVEFDQNKFGYFYNEDFIFNNEDKLI